MPSHTDCEPSVEDIAACGEGAVCSARAEERRGPSAAKPMNATTTMRVFMSDLSFLPTSARSACRGLHIGVARGLEQDVMVDGQIRCGLEQETRRSGERSATARGPFGGAACPAGRRSPPDRGDARTQRAQYGSRITPTPVVCAAARRRRTSNAPCVTSGPRGEARTSWPPTLLFNSGRPYFIQSESAL